MPFVSKRYILTDRQLMVQRGLKPSPTREVRLEDIDEVRLVPGSTSTFYRAGTLEVLSKRQVVLKP